MSDLKKGEQIKEQYKPSIHLVKQYYAKRTQSRNANNRVIAMILPEYADTLNTGPTRKFHITVTPESFINKHKDEIVTGLLGMLQDIDNRKSKLTSSERSAVIDLWINFSKDEKKDNTESSRPIEG